MASSLAMNKVMTKRVWLEAGLPTPGYRALTDASEVNAAAQALGLGGVVGNLAPGCEADFVVLDPQATPLLARRSAQAESLDELLFALIVLGDERAVERCVRAGQPD